MTDEKIPKAMHVLKDGIDGLPLVLRNSFLAIDELKLIIRIVFSHNRTAAVEDGPGILDRSGVKGRHRRADFGGVECCDLAGEPGVVEIDPRHDSEVIILPRRQIANRQ